MKKLLLGLLTSALLIAGCTSVTKTGALGIDRQQLMLVSYEKMDKISAEAYVKALKEARDKGKLNIDPILTKRVRDIANKLIAQTGTFRDDALKWKWQVNVVDEDTVNAWCMPGGRIVVYIGIATQFSIQMPFSRQHETEADRIGTELMARAGYDPKRGC